MCVSRQSGINIGSDRTLARAPVSMGAQRGPLIYILGPPFAVNVLLNENLCTKKFGMKKKIA
jgi:hypothetical protein